MNRILSLFALLVCSLSSFQVFAKLDSPEKIEKYLKNGTIFISKSNQTSLIFHENGEVELKHKNNTFSGTYKITQLFGFDPFKIDLNLHSNGGDAFALVDLTDNFPEIIFSEDKESIDGLTWRTNYTKELIHLIPEFY